MVARLAGLSGELCRHNIQPIPVAVSVKKLGISQVRSAEVPSVLFHLRLNHSTGPTVPPARTGRRRDLKAYPYHAGSSHHSNSGPLRKNIMVNFANQPLRSWELSQAQVLGTDCQPQLASYSSSPSWSTVSSTFSAFQSFFSASTSFTAAIFKMTPQRN